MGNLGSNNHTNNIKFAENVNANYLASQLDDFFDRHYTPVVERYLGEEPERKVIEGTKFHLQKLSDIHLKSYLSTELEPNGDIRTIYIFSTEGFPSFPLPSFILSISRRPDPPPGPGKLH